jgi:hypothetical protein
MHIRIACECWPWRQGRGYAVQVPDDAAGWERLAARQGGTVAGLASVSDATGETQVFAATSAELYRSSDHGQTWTATSLRDGVPFTETLAVSPNFARDRTHFVGGQHGLYRSLDAGASWQCVLSGGHVTSVAIGDDEHGEAVLLAGTQLDGIVCSRDGGRSWVSSNAGLLDLTVLALSLSPRFARDATGFAATASGVYRTRNAGRSWREVDVGAEVAAQCLAVSPTFGEDHLVLAGTEAEGLLRSDDGGARFDRVASLPSGGVTALAFSSRYPAHAAIAAATELGIGISEDAGESWRVVAADLGPVLTLEFVPRGDGEVLLAGLPRAGVARIVEADQHWTLVNDGLHARVLLALAFSPDFETDRTLFAAGLDDGVIVSHDAGQTWSAHLEQPDDPPVFGVTPSPDYAHDRTLYAATAIGGMRSQDGGSTWHSTSGDAELVPARTVVLAPPGTDGNAPIVAALADGRIVRSDDQAETWRSLDARFGDSEIVSLAITRNRTLFVGTRSARFGRPAEVTLWKSGESGGSWQRWLLEADSDVLPIGVSPTYSLDECVFVAVGGRVLRPLRQTREIRGAEQRPIWRGASVGEPGTRVTAVATPPDVGSGRVVFAASSAGVYVSRDGGERFERWGAADEGPNATVGLAVSPSYARDRLVYALGLDGTRWRRHDA